MVKQLVDNPLPRALLVLDTDPAAYPPTPAGGIRRGGCGRRGVTLRGAGRRGLARHPALRGLGYRDRGAAGRGHASNPGRPGGGGIRHTDAPAGEVAQLILASRATSLYVVTGSHAGGTAARVPEALGLVGEALLVQVGAAPGETSPRGGMRVVTGWTADDFALTPRK